MANQQQGSLDDRPPPRWTGRVPPGPGPETDVGQDLDGGLSAQPKAGMGGGFDPMLERLQPALGHAPVGGEEGVDTTDSAMSVVADPDRNVDEQPGARDATSFETGLLLDVSAERGRPPPGDEDQPTPDDTRGHRPRGTPEMGESQRYLQDRTRR